MFWLTKRKVIPHLTKFYKSNYIKDGRDEKQFSIQIPTILSSEIENINTFNNDGENDFTLPALRSENSKTLEKIVFTESIGLLPVPSPIEEPLPEPPDEPTQSGNVNVKDNGCIDNINSPIRSFAQDLERNVEISNLDMVESIPIQNSPLNIFLTWRNKEEK